MKCPECGYIAAGPSTLRFHQKHVCGDTAELRRLIEEQERDQQTRYWGSFSHLSLDRAYPMKNGKRESFAASLNEDGQLGKGDFWR